MRVSKVLVALNVLKIFLYNFRKNAQNRKNECAYGKELEALYSEYFVL